MNDITLLFVYGTLLRGERNHPRLGLAAFVGETATSNGFELRDLQRYPGMVKAGRGCVQGELYEVESSTLKELDILEGHPNHFWRTTISLADGRKAQAYLLSDEYAHGTPVLQGGDWLSRSTI